jgi:dolichyl-phosphate beta-glucosyltransferase
MECTVAATTITLILPVYNEANVIGSVFNRVRDFTRQNGDYHMLFVDDGSTDQTAARLADKIERTGMDQLQLLACDGNGGKGRAIRTAIKQCHSDLICYTDGDLAYSLDHVQRLVEALSEHDMVIGSRHLVAEPQANISLRRKGMGWLFNLGVRMILNLPYRDTQAGLKGFRAAAADRIFAHQQVDDFAFDAELLYLAKRLGMRIGQIPAHVSKRHSYKISTMNMLRDPAKMLGSVLRVRLNSLTGKYAKADPAEFRHRGVRRAAGIRPVDS